MEPDPVQLGSEVIVFCEAQGFALAGICPAGPTARPVELDQWLAAGKHGEMAWLAEDASTRKDPAQEQPGVRSIIMVADLYSSGRPDPPLPSGHASGRIARYARGRDYHWFIKRRLHRLNDELLKRYPQHRFRTFVDTAPVLEREHAARAGLGWIGKHTLLIHPRLGSYMLLGGTLTTMQLAMPDGPRQTPDHCGSCTRCIDACPTKAITPYSVDATRCISYLTIEQQQPIDSSLHGRMGQWVFGCDVCQEVCPHNEPRTERTANPQYATDRAAFDLLDMLGWTEDAKKQAILGTAMKRAGLEMLRRNAVIALGNHYAASPDQAALAAIERLANDPQETSLIRETAAAVLRRVTPSPQ